MSPDGAGELHGGYERGWCAAGTCRRDPGLCVCVRKRAHYSSLDERSCQLLLEEDPGLLQRFHSTCSTCRRVGIFYKDFNARVLLSS